MKVSVRYFGLIAESIGKTEEVFDLIGDTTVQEFIDDISEIYPSLLDLDFKMAINNSLVDDSDLIENDSELALLPPFAGG